MRSVGVWLRTKLVCLHILFAALITANVVALFSLNWSTGLTLQTTSLLVALVFILANRRSGAP